MVEAMAVRDGKIIETGAAANLESHYSFLEKLDAGGKYIYPGFIDAHAHFVGYALNLLRVNLVGTTSWEQILEKLQTFSKENPTGWILGEGWDQNDWENKNYPDLTSLNQLFPDRPVLLTRIDGHAAIANQKAVSLAGITGKERIIGGEVVVSKGKPTGILIDNAVEIVNKVIPPTNDDDFRKAILKAQQNCLAVGLTTIDDCGLDAPVVEKIKQLQDLDSLRIRLYVMLSDKPDNYTYAEKNGKLITDRLTVRSFKVYGDGALGSRGACLLKDYTSVQPTHATSDMYWAEKRLGNERIEHAYAYQTLLKQNGWIPLGTDFPVEDISPFKTFYAAVTRQDATGWPENGFQKKEALSREEALRGMTIWAARANFEETKKGSLEKGKWADFIILDKDLMKASPAELLKINTLSTYINGVKVHAAAQ